MKNKLYFPEVFQGEHLKENYFEGWYFKHSNASTSISIIAGISLEKDNKHSFIQIISENFSKYIKYDFSEFSCCNNPFYVQIGDSHFSKEGISININSENIKVWGKLEYSNLIGIKKSKSSPNIMGPFAYCSFLECYHGVISLYHNVNGVLTVIESNKESIYNFSNDVGYIEKDWGTNFPKSYIWCQANSFKEKNTSFFFSVAEIPFKKINFNGFICIMLVNGKEYRFATYNLSNIKEIKMNKSTISILLQKHMYKLYIDIERKDSRELIAPTLDGMTKVIKESINSEVNVKLLKGNKVVFEGFSSNAGLEIVK